MSNRHARAKSLTFDFLSHDDDDDEKKDREKEKEIGKSFSFISRTSEKSNHHHHHLLHHHHQHQHHDKSVLNNIVELEESEKVKFDQQNNLDQLSNDVDEFINLLSSGNCDSKRIETDFSPKVTIFLKRHEVKIDDYESEESPLTIGHNCYKDSDLIESINRISALHGALAASSRSDHQIKQLLNETSAILHRSMVFLEVELRLLLDESIDRNSNSSGSKNWDASLKNLKGRLQSFAAHPDFVIGGGDSNQLQEKKSEVGDEISNEGIPFPSFTSECVSNIRMINNAMILGGYESECYILFAIARRHAFEEELKKLGFDKVSIDDIQKMNWELMEVEILTWVRVFKYCLSDLIPYEQQFYESILSNHPTICPLLLGELACGVLSIIVNFAEAIAMTKRASDKLFRFLDMYETLRDSVALVKENKVDYPNQYMEEMREKLTFAQMVVGEAAMSIFCQLESSIKADSIRSPVPNGAIHPLIRSTMKYLEYACEYKDSLEEVFLHHIVAEQEDQQHYLNLKKHINHNKASDFDSDTDNNKSTKIEDGEKRMPYATQLIKIISLLDQNLDSKSKLYKDPSLRYIFMMNNGRYMLQKIRGSKGINQIVGDNWVRKRSSDVRNYHKSYQRESWTKVLQCLNHEGLQVHGKLYKPYLKDRFKNFNQLFDEIHRTQSMWVVSDDQLKSELRVSISAIMIPAYRSFVARFGQIFTPGRQTEKYIKYQPDDIESDIEDLFEGNTTSMAKRR